MFRLSRGIIKLALLLSILTLVIPSVVSSLPDEVDYSFTSKITIDDSEPFTGTPMNYSFTSKITIKDEHPYTGTYMNYSATLNVTISTFYDSEISNLSLTNGSVIYTNDITRWECWISDKDPETFNWTIETSPDVGDNSSNEVYNSTCGIDLSGLSDDTLYTVYVNVTDNSIQHRTNNSWFTFNTSLDSCLSESNSITIDSDYIEENLTGFPVLVRIPSSIGDKCDQGKSIRFWNETGDIRFQHETEYPWNVGGENYAWVNITETIHNDTDYVFAIHYNCSDAIDDSNPEAVWNSSRFVMVQHFNDSTNNIDSTSHSNDLVDDGDIEKSATGKIGPCYYFPGDAWMEELTDTKLPAMVTDELAFEYWVKLNHSPAPTAHEYFMQITETDENDAGHVAGINVGNLTDVYETTTHYYGSEELVNITWYHQVVQFDESPSNVALYVNGTEDTAGDLPTALIENMYTSGHYMISSEHDSGSPGQYMMGWLDEVRVHKVIPSDGWINTSYHNQNNSTGFMTFGDLPWYNSCPESNTANPANKTTDVGISQGTFTINIFDDDGNTTTGDFEMSPDKQSGDNSWSAQANGTKTMNLLTLAYGTNYTIWVNYSDIYGCDVNESFWFITVADTGCPESSAESPTNKTLDVSRTVGSWYVTIEDPGGDTTDGNITCSNGEWQDWTSQANGTRTLTLSALANYENFTIWLNFTDGTCDVNETYWFWTEDTDAPTPDPLTWNIEPTEQSVSTELFMRSTTASDDQSPISYSFEFVSSPTGGTGGTNSGWQSGDVTYIDDGLQENHNYTYKCQARDVELNVGGYSSTEGSYTYCEDPTDGEVTIYNYGDTWINVTVDECGNPDDAEVYIDCVSGGATDSGWIITRSGGHFYHNFTGLTEQTEYCFRAKYRNGDDLESSLNTNPICETTKWTNDCPVGSNEDPTNKSYGVSVNVGFWNITINDIDGNTTSGSIECSNGNFTTWSTQANGTRSCELNVTLSSYINHTVWVNFTDGYCDVNETYWFWSEWVNEPPWHSNPSPANGSENVTGVTSLSVTINDQTTNQTINTTWQYWDEDHWWTFAYNETMLDEVITQPLANISEDGNNYYWRVSSNDGATPALWDNDTYWFWTQGDPIIYVNDSKYAYWYNFYHVETIQEGINNASMNWTVILEVGEHNITPSGATYMGIFNGTNDKNITLQGEHPTNSIINGSITEQDHISNLTELNLSRAFYIGESNITIKNLTIKNCGQDKCYLYDGNATIYINATNSTSVRVENITLYNITFISQGTFNNTVNGTIDIYHHFGYGFGTPAIINNGLTTYIHNCTFEDIRPNSYLSCVDDYLYRTSPYVIDNGPYETLNMNTNLTAENLTFTDCGDWIINISGHNNIIKDFTVYGVNNTEGDAVSGDVSDLVLYAGSTEPGLVYRYEGDSVWTNITTGGKLDDGVLDIIEYEGYIYAGTYNNTFYEGRVWRFPTVGAGDWELVGEGLDTEVHCFAIYRGDLYAGTASNGMRLYRYDGDTNWTQQLPTTPYNGIRSMYVYNDLLLLGEDGYDRFGYWDGTNFVITQSASIGSCIWDFQEFKGEMYAGAFLGTMWNSSDGGLTWTEGYIEVGQNLWELEEFRGDLYIGYGGGSVRKTDVPDMGTIIFDAPNDVIAMSALDRYIYFGVGCDNSWYSCYECDAVDCDSGVYRYDPNTNTTTLVTGSADFRAGVQVLYTAGEGLQDMDFNTKTYGVFSCYESNYTEIYDCNIYDLQEMHGQGFRNISQNENGEWEVDEFGYRFITSSDHNSDKYTNITDCLFDDTEFTPVVNTHITDNDKIHNLTFINCRTNWTYNMEPHSILVANVSVDYNNGGEGIHNNTFRDCRSDVIEINSHNFTTVVEVEIDIYNNTILRTQTWDLESDADPIAIKTLDILANSTIHNNTIEGPGIEGSGIAAYMKNVTITNNSISRHYFSLSIYGQNLTIINNLIRDNSQGIIIRPSNAENLDGKNCTIYNNWFRNAYDIWDTPYDYIDLQNNTLNVTKVLGTNIIGGPYMGGNYWQWSYGGSDFDGDYLGDNLLPFTGYIISAYGDNHPLLPDTAFVIIHINDKVNDSYIFEDSRYLQWRGSNDTSEIYHLQIANDTSFSDIFIELDNVSLDNTNLLSMPGASMEDWGFYVNFSIPYKWNNTHQGGHYYRVRVNNSPTWTVYWKMYNRQWSTTIRNDGVDYFIWFGADTTASVVDNYIADFNELAEHIAIWRNGTWGGEVGNWERWFGDGSGSNFNIKTYDVIEVLLTDSGTQVITAPLDETFDYISSRIVTLQNNSITRGGNYTGYSQLNTSTLALLAIDSGLDAGEYLTLWDETLFTWQFYIVGVYQPNIAVPIDSVIFTKVENTETWTIGGK